ncbi:Cytochrome c [Marinomonas aquimarina]|uniref:Cytochrome c n=1 Tax=Marinomonas aquimarina TaxID=295068 RepID=A0A1A8TJ16_9GAMM|nr:di-heme oxidoredictase family protein [Marinomonas aquimarina]SBS33409.1 Cytochrome c [Marinomonas aquimarina]
MALLTRFLLSLTCSSFAIASVADSDAYKQPFSNMPGELKHEFFLGESVFERFWVPSPSSTTASDGLGPLFNARSCHSCHINSGRGHAPTADQLGSEVPSFFIRLGSKSQTSLNGVVGDAMYGRQFHPLSATNIQPEGNYRIEWQERIESFPDGYSVTLRKPSITWTQLNYGEFQQDTGFSMRVSPPLVGMGLLDAVNSTLILEYQDIEDADQDGISGKANWIEHQGVKQLGKFGHKASVSTLTAQNQSAFNGDIGLSTPLFPLASGDCTAQQTDCMIAPNGNSQHIDNLEVGVEQSRLLDLYLALSRPPAMRNLDQPWFKEAKKLFDDAHCASCHRAKLTTGSSQYKVLSNRDFYPFTDMLLHDMGPDLANDFPVLNADPQEWRTAPLWGIGLSEQVSSRNGYLHDGRARTIEEAILWHGGEAQASKEAYKSLNAKQRTLFIRFLESL